MDFDEREMKSNEQQKNGVKSKKRWYGVEFYNRVDGARGHVRTRRLFAFYLQRVL